MRLATWNVNSITARLPRLLDWLETRQPADEPGFSDPEARAVAATCGRFRVR